MSSLRGAFTARGHEFCTQPPIVTEPIIPQNADRAQILHCHKVQELEQGLYIISKPLLIDPTNIPEARHHIFLQVYQDPAVQPEIAQAQARVDQIRKGFLGNTPRGSLLVKMIKLDKATKNLKSVQEHANRARMIEVHGPSWNFRGSIITIASVDHGQTITPDLSHPYMVVSPILTKSDVEKANGIWIDPDWSALQESIARITRTPYNPLGTNCKFAALEWAKSALDAMPGLTAEMRKTAEKNMEKPINANASFTQVIRNAAGRTFEKFAVFSNVTDQLPKFPSMDGLKISPNNSGIQDSIDNPFL